MIRYLGKGGRFSNPAIGETNVYNEGSAMIYIRVVYQRGRQLHLRPGPWDQMDSIYPLVQDDAGLNGLLLSKHDQAFIPDRL